MQVEVQIWNAVLKYKLEYSLKCKIEMQIENYNFNMHV